MALAPDRPVVPSAPKARVQPSTFAAAVAALVLALAVGAATEHVARLEAGRVATQQRENVVSKVGEYRAALEGELNATLYLTNGLTAYVAQGTRLDPDVAQAMLAALHGHARHTRNIGLAPGNRITHVYPVAGNEKALGLYYPDIPDQWPAIERAIRERKATLAGPVALKQGGLGFIYRVPVFSGHEGDYWGLLSMVIDQDSLFSFVGTGPSRDGLEIAIRGRDGAGARGEAFFGDTSLFEGDSVKAMVRLPGGSWQLAARPAGGWKQSSRDDWIRAGGWTLAALLGALLYVALTSMARRGLAERVLRASRDELNEAQHIAGVGSWALDLRTGKLSWSEETRRIFGLSGDASPSLETFLARVHDDDRERVVAAWDAAMKGDGSYSIEHRILVDGEEKWVHERGSVAFSPDGTPLTGIGSVLDITARKRAEIERNRIYEVLRQNEERLREAQRVAQIGNWELDLRTLRLNVSDYVATIIGRGEVATDLAFADYLAMVHPEDRLWVKTRFDDSTAGRREFDAVYRLNVADGTLKYVHQRNEAAALGEDPVRLVGTLQDVTLERLNQEALKESEERFRTVADYNYDWEYWRDPSGAYLYLSPSCERITGYAQHEFIGDPELTERIVHPEDRTRVLCHLGDAADDSDHTLDFRIIRKNGEVRWIAHGCRPVFAHDGTFLGRRSSNRDITDRKRTEAALLEAKNCLALALDASQLSIWDLDVESRMVMLDARWGSIVGGDAGVTATTADELKRHIHPDDLERVAEAARALFGGELPMFQQEFRFRAVDGSWKWLRSSGTILERNAEGKPLRAIGTTMDITERKHVEEDIRRMAFHDRLTLLPNRRLLEDRLRQVMTRAQRERKGLSLLFIDLDKFKPINDEFGHAAGDWLLQRVAERMQACLRESDTVARVGGDEFVVLLPDAATRADATGVAEKIRAALLDAFVTPEGHRLQISCSIGVALYPEHAEDLRELLRCGDEAMYRAKNAGRNAVEVFTPRT